MPAMQSAAYQSSVDTETATESDVGEMRGLIRHSEQEAGARLPPRYALFGVAVSAVLLCGVMAVNGFSKSTANKSNADMTLGDGLVSAVSSKTKVTHRVGCNNWERIRLKLIMDLASDDDCETHCKLTSGCTSFGYQPTDCGDPDLAVKKAACYLWYDTCDEGPNTCWDEYTLDPSEIKPPTWQITGPRMGCSNWASIQMGNGSIEDSAGACGLKCESTPGCQGFGFQPGVCSGEERAAQGACYLWKGPCQQEKNPCWDNYQQSVVTTLAAEAKKGDTTLQLSPILHLGSPMPTTRRLTDKAGVAQQQTTTKQDGQQEGQQATTTKQEEEAGETPSGELPGFTQNSPVTIMDPSGTPTETKTITKIKDTTITIDKPLENDYPAGAWVSVPKAWFWAGSYSSFYNVCIPYDGSGPSTHYPCTCGYANCLSGICNAVTSECKEYASSTPVANAN